MPFSQFFKFFTQALTMFFMENKVFFYTWNASLGLNYLSLISYYLGGLFTPLVFFSLTIKTCLMRSISLTLLKIGSAGLSFWFLAKQTFKIPKWSHVTLSVSYALMSFIVAHSELIMWLDAFIYLPLVIFRNSSFNGPTKTDIIVCQLFLAFSLQIIILAFMIRVVFPSCTIFARTFTDWQRYKSRIVAYFTTSLLAGGASMIMVLPAVLDLRTNGETLSEITTFKNRSDCLFRYYYEKYDWRLRYNQIWVHSFLFTLGCCL